MSRKIFNEKLTEKSRALRTQSKAKKSTSTRVFKNVWMWKAQNSVSRMKYIGYKICVCTTNKRSIEWLKLNWSVCRYNGPFYIHSFIVCVEVYVCLYVLRNWTVYCTIVFVAFTLNFCPPYITPCSVRFGCTGAHIALCVCDAVLCIYRILCLFINVFMHANRHLDIYRVNDSFVHLILNVILVFARQKFFNTIRKG